MQEKAKHPGVRGGRFLDRGSPVGASGQPRGGKIGRYLAVAILLLGDGLLIYMILHCLIVPVYGAAFVAAVSVSIGYQINQEV